MRIFCLALMGLLTAVAAASAQQQPAPTQNTPPPPAVDAAKLLDAHLLRWEDEMKKVQTLKLEGIKRIDVNNTLKYKDELIGEALYRKPNLALLYLRRTDKKDIFERWICTGAAIYQFAPQEKVIYVHQLPVRKEGQVGDDNFLSFMFGMKAEDAKKRYGLEIQKGKENDPYYVYITILPKDARDKADFQEARLVLNKDSYLPRQLWFRHPNGDETTWDIPRAQSGVEVDRLLFQAPQVPKDWKMTQVQKTGEAPPRIVRQKQP
jgi:TIGR03009 family protein